MLIEGAYYVGDAPLHIRKDFQISESRFGFQKELFRISEFAMICMLIERQNGKMFRISQVNVSDITFGYRFGYPKSFSDLL